MKNILIISIIILVSKTAFAYHNNSDGTISDGSTRLMWQQTTNDRRNWENALLLCENLSLAGFDDWRLPSVNELRSIVDYSRLNKRDGDVVAIDLTHFPDTFRGLYWSSTTDSYVDQYNHSYADRAWRVNFTNGRTYRGPDALKSNSYYVKCVRNAQPHELHQERPNQSIVQPVIIDNKNAVVVTHGYRSSVEAWALDDTYEEGTADRICKSLDPNVQLEKVDDYTNKLFKRCNVNGWDVWVYDWRKKAKKLNPISAFNEAFDQGVHLAKLLEVFEYEHIHMIAHSAGANLINTTKTWLRGSDRTIHLTFFDAYDPLAIITADGQLISGYGEYADFVDNYVDTRTLDSILIGELDATKLLMPNAFNIDVTAWDKREEPLPPLTAPFRHEWPYLFYNEWTFTPMIYDLGYRLALESGSFPPIDREKGEICNLSEDGQLGQPICDHFGNVFDWLGSNEQFRTIGDTSVVVTQITNSVTGVSQIFSNPLGLLNYWLLETGSPIWTNMEISLMDPVDSLQFDYEFLSEIGAEGYLTVFFDGILIGHIDERYGNNEITTTPRFSLGSVLPGVHNLSIRVDPYTGVKSSIKLSNVNFYYKTPGVGDIIQLLQMLTGDGIDVSKYKDINGDNLIGIEEVIFILQQVSRPFSQ